MGPVPWIYCYGHFLRKASLVRLLMGPATNSRLWKRLSLSPSLPSFVIKLFRANPLFLVATYAKCKGKKFHRSLNPRGSEIRKAAGKNWRKKWLGLLVSWYAVGVKDDCLLIKFEWTPCPHHSLLLAYRTQHPLISFVTLCCPLLGVWFFH